MTIDENSKNKSILVTGAAGFIGNSLSYELLRQNETVFCIDNFNEYYDPELKKSRKKRLDNLCTDNDILSEKYLFRTLDLRDKASVFSFFEKYKPGIVCHLAAQAGVRYSIQYPQTYVDNNITATINLLEACQRYNVKDFIFASTSSVYGLNTEMPFNEQTSIDTTISTYSSTKRACELLCHTYHNLYEIRFRILRFFTVYGPWGRPDMALFLFTKAILERKPIQVYNHGEMKRDFTYIDDIVAGFISAIRTKLDFEIINLGCGESIDLMFFINTLEKKLDIESKKEFVSMQPGDVTRTWADITKAQQLLNYEPNVRVTEGISRFVEWYRNHYGKSV